MRFDLELYHEASGYCLREKWKVMNEKSVLYEFLTSFEIVTMPFIRLFSCFVTQSLR